jgi:hypothetical protein
VTWRVAEGRAGGDRRLFVVLHGQRCSIVFWCVARVARATGEHEAVSLSQRWIAVLLGALSVTSCVAPRTQIVVVVDTDYAIPAEAGSLRITVDDPAGGEHTVRAITLSGSSSSGCMDAPNGARFCIPLSFLMVPTQPRDTTKPVQVMVEAVVGADGMSGRALVSRTARMPFAYGQTLRLPMFLARACESVQCGAGLTCSEGGQCIPIDQPPGLSVIDPTTGLRLDTGVVDAQSGSDATALEDSTLPNRDSALLRDAMPRPDVMAGMPDVGRMPDVMGGMPDVMGGMPDVMGGMPDSGRVMDGGAGERDSGSGRTDADDSDSRMGGRPG